jgi:5-deoxy-glucuronate isomerase
MLIKLGQIKAGYNEITNMDSKCQSMLMDIGVQKIPEGQMIHHLNAEKEAAFLLLNGEVVFKWNDQEVSAQRASLFDENPSVLHVPKGTEVTIKAVKSSELIVQMTTNSNVFDPIFMPKKIATLEF